MPRFRNYDLNPETLMYEIAQVPLRRRLVRIGVAFLISVMLAAFYFWLYSSVLGLDSPKLAIMKARNSYWSSKVALLNRDMDQYEEALAALDMRNADIYRSIFGMNAVPQEVLDAGLGGPSRYAFLDDIGRGSKLKGTYVRLDRLTKRAYVESKSYDEVAALAQRAGDMASCIPAIPPVEPRLCNVTSPFGGREDPVYGGLRMHNGVDMAAQIGTPVYASGDGVVESVRFQFFGYGNMLTIDHGFGYKTNYAHLNNVYVVEGMQIKRGECIGSVGRSGKATGSHLHYEVEYKGNKINPANFYDMSIKSSEYAAMVKHRDNETMTIQRPQFVVKTR